MFSSSASKIATKATENAIKIGGIASQKVTLHFDREIVFCLFFLS